MRSRVVMLTAVAPALWGTTYVVTTELLPPGRPLLAAALRALPAGAVLVATTGPLPRGAWWWRSAVLGALNFGLFFALLFTAAYRLPGGVAATVGAVQPLIVLGLAVAVLGERTVPAKVLAGVVGVVGVGLLVLDGNARLDPVGVLAALAGAASMATGTVLVQRWGSPVRVATFAGWQLAAGGLMLLPIALAVEGRPQTLTGPNLFGYGYLAVIGGAVAYVLWFRGIERLGARNVTFLSLLSPVVATVIGVIGGDRFGGWQVAGALAVLGSVVAVQVQPGTGRRPASVVLRDDERSTRGAASMPEADDRLVGARPQDLLGPGHRREPQHHGVGPGPATLGHVNRTSRDGHDLAGVATEEDRGRGLPIRLEPVAVVDVVVEDHQCGHLPNVRPAP